MAKSKYQSKISGVVHRAAADLHEIGGIDKKTMRDFDAMCLTKVEKLSPR